MSGELVLVTGGSGFVGSHCILQLLAAGYRVRTTVRSLRREADVRALLKTGGSEPGERLTFAAADLTADAGWAEAVAGCDYVLHVASPFPSAAPKDENELIIPAREGALRVLHAARDAGVRRVVLTSSFAAIGYGHPQTERPFTEADWTELDGSDVSAYVKSKTLAERAAWDFMAREGGALELAVVNPVGIFGPALGADTSSSIQIVEQLMKGAMPGLPKLSFNVVDVRDVADLHLRAMTHPAAKGERFLAASGTIMSLPEVARVLREHMGEAARNVPTRTFPDWLLRLLARVAPTAKQVVPELGKVRKASSEKARRVLGWTPRSNEETIVATAESLVRLGLLQNAEQGG
ncbi:MAG: NAD-dependent epimerase/dehydratase family protein [Chloroflexi bacterium]|nr:NAD-dependent epimerase/dehydratase family protein [Chloroflexota bacterium]